MYYDYFGLKQPPFKITPDTNLFFPGGERGAILEALVYAVTSGEGIIKVVGEVGSGKTMLCRMLQKELPETVEVVYLANPNLSPDNILHAIAFELRLSTDANSSKLQVMQQLQNYLLEKHSNNQQVVVFVEEAQGMPLATLEEIRLLSNLETSQSKLLQIVLFGQPELDVMISQKEIRQLKERVTYSFQLNPFKINDIRDYLNTRLRSCGYRAGQIFDDSAIKAIGKYSTGLVRRINILADKSMLAAYANNTNNVTKKHVHQAARDSEFISNRWRKWVPVLGLFVVLGVGLAVFWQMQSSGTAVIMTGSSIQSPPSASDTMQEVGELVLVQEVEEESQRVQRQENEHTVVADISQVESDSAVSVAMDDALKIRNNAIKTISNKVDLRLSKEIASSHLYTQKQIESRVTESEYIDQTDHPSDDITLVRQDETLVAVVNIGPKVGRFENQLIGMDEVFKLQDMGDSRLTDQEMSILHRQLESLPPEAAIQLDSSIQDMECKLCWSIIYRPLVDSGNL